MTAQSPYISKLIRLYGIVQVHLKGKNPIIVEVRNDLMAVPGICLANTSYLRDYFNWKKVPVYLESSVAEIKDKTVVIKTQNGDEEVKADSVIFAKSNGCRNNSSSV